MNTRSSNPVSMSEQDLNHPRSLTAFRGMKLLVLAYLALSLLTLVAIVLLRNETGVVNDAVWVRGTIVAATSLLMYSFAVRAARGSRKGFLRVRIMSAAMVVAIAVIISLPGTFPVWLKIEQAGCGLILIGVVVVVNGKHLRSLFAAK